MKASWTIALWTAVLVGAWPVLPGFAQVPNDRIVGITPMSEDTINCGNGEYAVALSRSGNVFRFFPATHLGERVWTFDGNIWELTGAPPSGDFCGVARYLSSPATLLAITKSGQSFFMSNGVWQLEGHIGDLSGREPTTNFATLVKGNLAWAITESGEIYQRGQQVGTWVYLRSIEEDTGVVAKQSTPYGNLKALFR